MPNASPSAHALDARELRAWRGILQVHAAVTQALDAQMRSEHGLSLSSYEVLDALGDAPARRLRMADIADRALLSRSGLTRLVDRLVELELVERRACSDDGRGAFAQLTGAGAEQLVAARRTHLEGVRRFFLDRLTDGDLRTLGDAWSRLEA